VVDSILQQKIDVRVDTNKKSMLAAWWFGTFFHILGRIIPTDELIFFRGVETTNQLGWII
jgi:hypothetical protein